MALNTNLINEIFDAIRSRLTLVEIELLLVSDPLELIRLIEEYTTEEFQARMVPQIETLILLEGAPAAIIELLPTGAVTAPYLFSISSQSVAEFIRNYVGNDIAQITENTVAGIRQQILRNESQGTNPRVAARQFRDSIGLTARQELAVDRYRRNLENLDRDTLRRELRDRRSDGVVRRAIENDKPLSQKQIDSLVSRYRQRYINYRSEVIARTEQLKAVSVGQRQSMLQAFRENKLSPRLRRDWIFTFDGRTRCHHRSVPGLNPQGVRIDEPYLTEPPGRIEYLDMPRDPSGSADNVILCRCREKYRLL